MYRFWYTVCYILNTEKGKGGTGYAVLRMRSPLAEPLKSEIQKRRQIHGNEKGNGHQREQ